MNAPIMLGNPVHARALDRAQADLQRHFPCVIISVLSEDGRFLQKIDGLSERVEALNDAAHKNVVIQLFRQRQQAAAQAVKAAQSLAPVDLAALHVVET
jgi:hypothetical protein